MFPSSQLNVMRAMSIGESCDCKDQIQDNYR